MKRFIYFIVTLVAIAAGAPYILPGDDGKPMLDPAEVEMPELALPDISLPYSSNAKPTNSVEKSHNAAMPPARNRVNVYRWQDSDGQWHFSNDDPNREDVETVQVRTNINTIPSITESNRGKYSSGGSGVTSWSSPSQILNTEPTEGGFDYSVESVKQLMNDARDVENLLNERKENQDAMIGASE